LRASGAALYALMLGSPSGPISDEARNRNMALDKGTTDSGGRRGQVLAPSALKDPLTLLATQLLHMSRATSARRPSLIPHERRPPLQVPFRAGIGLVSLNVTVTDGTAKYITDLSQDEFNVFEDGVKQDVTFFNKTNLPIALALLLDTSASMESKLPTAQEAAIGFAKKLRSQDLAEVVDFDSRVVVLQNFTNGLPELEQALR